METQNPQLDIDRIELTEWLEDKIQEENRYLQLTFFDSPHNVEEIFYKRGLIDAYRQLLFAVQTNKLDLKAVKYD